MNSVVMDKAYIGDECIIGALAFVPANFRCEPRKLIVGSPAKIIRDVSDEMINGKQKEQNYIRNWQEKEKKLFCLVNLLQNMFSRSLRKLLITAFGMMLNKIK
jgi:carbonic anhydrase/acetyltransferase-like protein (isoleucine patch superfamily)